MRVEDAVEIFHQLGWNPSKHVDYFAEKTFGNRVVHIGFKLKDFGVYERFEATNSLKVSEFTEAVFLIHGKKKNANTHFKVDLRHKVRFQDPEITRKHIEAACDKAIEWAMSVDIDQRYEELCNLDPSTPGAAGVWHLAALALKHHTDKLLTYQKKFETGDRCGFVNFITKDYIDRAVALAERGASA